MPDITIDDLRAARMRMTLSLDGDFYTNTFECDAYPELTRLDSGPNGHGRGEHTRRYFVAGEPVERSYEAIVAALNAHRAKDVVEADGDSDG